MNTKNLTDATTVQVLYDLLTDVIGADQTFTELTEGIWNDLDPRIEENYWNAREKQLDYLLNGVGCQNGSRVLDVGCGCGSLLVKAMKRGAVAEGLTLSPNQQKLCEERGTNVRVENYFNLATSTGSVYDSVVMNGSMEHFALAKDILSAEDIKKESDKIYRNAFEIAHRILKKNGKLAITVIHINRDPYDYVTCLYKNPLALLFTKGLEHFHFSMLAQGMGGYYPEVGQLEKVSSGLFRIVDKQIANQDYINTSNYWVRDMVRVFVNPLNWPKLIKHFIKNPSKVAKGALSLLPFVDCWRWQFGKKNDQNPPTYLLRYVFERID